MPFLRRGGVTARPVFVRLAHPQRKPHDHAPDHSARKCDAPVQLNEKEKDIIVKHMWPLTPAFPKKYAESFVVSTADKLCALAEIFHVYRRLRVRENLDFLPKKSLEQSPDSSQSVLLHDRWKSGVVCVIISLNTIDSEDEICRKLSESFYYRSFQICRCWKRRRRFKVSVRGAGCSNPKKGKKDHTSYVLCIKGEREACRKEIEWNLTEDVFQELEEFLEIPMVRKEYRVYALEDGHRLECSWVDRGTNRISLCR